MRHGLQTTSQSVDVSPPIHWEDGVLLTIISSSARWQEIAVGILLRYSDLQPVPSEGFRDVKACDLGGSVTVIVRDRDSAIDS